MIGLSRQTVAELLLSICVVWCYRGCACADGVDVWALLTKQTSAQPRRYLPTTESSIIDTASAEGFKLINLVGSSRYYQTDQTGANIAPSPFVVPLHLSNPAPDCCPEPVLANDQFHTYR